MNRYAVTSFAASLLLVSALDARGDIVVGTIDFYTQTPLGIRRFDDSLQTGAATELTAADIPAFSIPVSEQFGVPFGTTDVAVSPTGDLYFSDISGSIFAVNSKTGAPLPSPIGGPAGYIAGYQFQAGALTFSSLAFGPSGLLYVVDSYDTTNLFAYNTPGDDGILTPGVRVIDPSSGFQVDQLFDVPGSYTAPSTTLSSVAFTADGNLLMSDTAGSRIYAVDITSTPGTEIITDLITGIDIDGEPGPDPFYPSGMAVDPTSGAIYVANLGGNNILRFDADGSNATVLATIRPDDPADINSLFGVPSHNPTDIVFDRDGNLLVSVLGDKNLYVNNMPQQTEGGILRFDTSGNLLQVVAENLFPASGIALVDDLLPGDYDGNGVVDAADYAEWQLHFGSSTPPYTGADGNGDGMVDLADYTVWRDTLGATGLLPSESLASAAVPEPGTALLAGAMVLGLLGVRRTMLSCKH